MALRFDILSLFPQPLENYCQSSLLGKAAQKNLVEFHFHQLRDWALDKHRRVDDETFGGGEGMVFKPEPLVAAIEAIRQNDKKSRTIYLSPQGKLLDQNVARELLEYEQLVLICGRYEGIDERVIEGWVDEEISLGNFILLGGEIPALALLEAVTRLIPGVVGKAQSLEDESLAQGLLEYPHYTRPADFRGKTVPEVLISGNHREIEKWRRERSLERTRQKRPDLLKKKSTP